MFAVKKTHQITAIDEIQLMRKMVSLDMISLYGIVNNYQQVPFSEILVHGSSINLYYFIEAKMWTYVMAS